MNKLIRHLDEAEYFKNEAMSNSKLKPLERSGAHFLAELEKEHQPTRAQVVGKLVHAMCLEFSEIEKRYLCVDKKLDLRTKAGKEVKEQAEADGKEIITAGDFEMAHDIRRALINHKGANALLYKSTGDAEVSAFWVDDETGIQCKGRFDFLTDMGFIVDLKTTLDASSQSFQKTVGSFSYHRQAAMYIDGYTAIHNKPPLGFVFVVVEKDAPYGVACYQLDDKSIEQGRREYKRLLRKYKIFKDANDFPAYPHTVDEISVAGWALDEDLRNER